MAPIKLFTERNVFYVTPTITRRATSITREINILIYPSGVDDDDTARNHNNLSGHCQLNALFVHLLGRRTTEVSIRTAPPGTGNNKVNVMLTSLGT